LRPSAASWGVAAMLRDLTIGQYVPGDSVVHRLDARTKILSAFAFIVLVFFIETYVGYAWLALGLILVVFLSGIPVKFVLKGIKPLWIIILITVVINLFFSKEGTALISFWGITITDTGMRMAVFMAARLVLLITGTSILTLTTSPISLTDGLESLMSPLKAIKFPAHELAMMMTIALRFIPTLMEETERIMKAQKARGADFESGRLMQRAKALVPLLVPLFVGAFRRADELALAMEARCYRGGEGRTRMKQLQFTRRDLYAALLLLIWFTAGLVESHWIPL
jgi:energy-coupling factor transport system permease protein